MSGLKILINVTIKKTHPQTPSLKKRRGSLNPSLSNREI
jgi:hypothetical protein